MLKYLDLQRLNAQHTAEFNIAVQRVIESGWYLLGEEVSAFEDEYARYIDTTHCIACANGLDALTLIFRAYIEQGILQPGEDRRKTNKSHAGSAYCASVRALRFHQRGGRHL